MCVCMYVCALCHDRGVVALVGVLIDRSHGGSRVKAPAGTRVDQRPKSRENERLNNSG